MPWSSPASVSFAGFTASAARARLVHKVLSSGEMASASAYFCIAERGSDDMATSASEVRVFNPSFGAGLAVVIFWR